MSDNYDHPIPDQIVRRAGRHYHGVSPAQVHEALEEIDQMQFLRDELQQFDSRTDKFEKIKYSLGVEYYRVRSNWCSRVTTELDEPHYRIRAALNQCYDRTVTKKTNANIGNGEGFVITDRS